MHHHHSLQSMLYVICLYRCVKNAYIQNIDIKERYSINATNVSLLFSKFYCWLPWAWQSCASLFSLGFFSLFPAEKIPDFPPSPPVSPLLQSVFRGIHKIVDRCRNSARKQRYYCVVAIECSVFVEESVFYSMMLQLDNLEPFCFVSISHGFFQEISDSPKTTHPPLSHDSQGKTIGRIVFNLKAEHQNKTIRVFPAWEWSAPRQGPWYNAPTGVSKLLSLFVCLSKCESFVQLACAAYYYHDNHEEKLSAGKSVDAAVKVNHCHAT